MVTYCEKRRKVQVRNRSSWMVHTQASMTTDAELEDCQIMRDVSNGTDLVNIPVSAT
jgi:hypothetical protein